MTRYIDGDALYEQIAKKEELARQRVLDTPSRMPNGDFNPSALHYATQLAERTQMKYMIADAPTIEAIPIKWIIRNRNKHNNDGFAWIFDAVLDDWRKEHGKAD